MNTPLFKPETIGFLRELAENNQKDWFESHRDRYEAYLVQPMRSLASQLQPVMLGIDPRLETAPSIGKAVSRIHRDTRFSNDKTPYRTEAWVSFKQPKRLRETAPEFFVFFTTEKLEIGLGYYCAAPADMARFRRNIQDDPERFEAFLDALEKRPEIKLTGEEYKKKIANDLPERIQPWFQKKNFYAGCTLDFDPVFYGPGLAAFSAEVFTNLKELYAFLIEEER